MQTSDSFDKLEYNIDIQITPLNFTSNGRYNFDSGIPAGRNNNGYFWQLEATMRSASGNSLFTPDLFDPQYSLYKGYGLSIRCLVSLVSRQLPTYSGTKSYQNLLVEVYGGIESYDWPSSHLDAIIQNSPISLIRSGYYDYSSGGIRARSSNGFYWESNSYAATTAWLLDFYSTHLVSQNSSTKGYGWSLRCLVR